LRGRLTQINMLPLFPLHLLRAYDQATSLGDQPFEPLTDFAQAQRIARDITQLRVARGEKPVGYKIGFTNRSIWPLYGVSRPIWAPVYDTTVTHLPSDTAQIGLGRFVEPRLEPEIVIGLKAAPRDDSLAAILDAISWVAHGFEIVQSHFPNWKFTAALAHASQGLHGALLIGPKTVIEPCFTGLADTLSKARMALCLGSSRVGGEYRLIEEGVGAHVLDGPLQALAFLVRGLKEEGQSLKAGDVVTTGTLTDAKPMYVGQSWRSDWLSRSVSNIKGEVLVQASNDHGRLQQDRLIQEQLTLARHDKFLLSNLALDVV
jgi:2-keto-4-pentenoate hydratase